MRSSGSADGLQIPDHAGVSCMEMATPARFELATYGLEVRCSIQLSYGARREDFPLAYPYFSVTNARHSDLRKVRKPLPNQKKVGNPARRSVRWEAIGAQNTPAYRQGNVIHLNIRVATQQLSRSGRTSGVPHRRQYRGDFRRCRPCVACGRRHAGCRHDPGALEPTVKTSPLAGRKAFLPVCRMGNVA